MNDSVKKAQSFLDDEIRRLIGRIREGGKEEGLAMSQSDCKLMMIYLRCCVNIVPLVEALHNVITQTIVDWKMVPDDDEDETAPSDDRLAIGGIRKGQCQ